VLTLSSDRLDGGPGTLFQFSTTVVGPETPSAITWDLGNGQTATGPTAEISFSAPGVYTVRATAAFPSAGSAASELDVSVLDPQGGGVLVGTEVPMPPLLGDVDGDSALTQLDVARISAHVQGTSLLSGSEWRVADYHLDGSVDQRDVDLLSQAVNQGGLLPDSIEPQTGPRGTPVQIISDRLRDVEALIEVRVGLAPPLPVRRLHPGYGLFVIPMDAVGSPTTAPISEGIVPIDLLIDGLAVQSFDFNLTNPPTTVGDEVELLRSSGHELASAAFALRDAMAVQGDLVGTTADDRRVLAALLDYAGSEFSKAAQAIDGFTTQLTPAQRDRLAYICNLAGLRESRTAALALLVGASGTKSLQVQGTGNTAVDLIYGAKKLLDFADTVYTVTQTACLAAAGTAALSSLAIGPIGLVIGTKILAACASMETASSVVAAVYALWPTMKGNLTVTATLQAGSSPSSYTVRVAAPLEKGVICGTGMGVAEIVQGILVEKLTKKLAVFLSFQTLQNFFPFEQLTGELRQTVLSYVKAFLEGLGSAVGYALDVLGIGQWLEDLKDKTCQAVSSVDLNSIAVQYPQLSSLTYSPTNAGTFAPLGPASTFEFECASGTSNAVTIQAQLPVAGSEPFVGSTQVTCSGGCPSGFPTPSGLVAIQPGTFQMGSNAAGGPPYFGQSGEKPVHPVTISYCFWMGRTEVTQAQYQALMGTNPSAFVGANRPVERVTWFNAQAYCAALTAQQSALGNVPVGYHYRLPTEAEWEYACRAGTTTEFNVGSALFCNQARFWYSYHSNSSCGVTFQSGHLPVGSYPANAWGLFDMHGNVWEWCLDSFASYPAGAGTDPFVTNGPNRVLRGGSWSINSFDCRSAVRSLNTPGNTDDDLGFRVVLAPVLVP
jgi:formylglycine-generating enzyme required for sulfatase activity